MKKLIRWEIVVAAVVIAIYGICLFFGIEPKGAAIVAAVIAFVAFGTIAFFVVTQNTAFTALASSAVGGCVAFMFTPSLFATLFFAVIAGATALIVSDQLRVKYRWIFLSLVAEAAAIWVVMFCGGRLFG